MVEKVEWLVDWAFKVAVLVYAFVKLVKARIEKRRTENAASKEDKQIQKNAERQKEKEEELKQMAKFLCDRCGKEIEVKDGKRYESETLNADLCPECYFIMQEREEKIARARANVEEAKAALEQAQQELFRFTGENGANSDESTPLEQSSEEEKPASVLDKLGL